MIRQLGDIGRSERGRAIDGVFLADAAEVDLHAGLERNAAALRHCTRVPADVAQQRRDVCARGHAIAAVEAPGSAQHARGDVEPTAAQLEQRRGVVEQARRLVVDVDGPAARAC